MKERGGQLLRTKVGDRYVIEAMRQHNAMLGGEQSGHLIFREYGTTGDGLLAALQILRIMREPDVPSPNWPTVSSSIRKAHQREHFPQDSL